MALGDGTHHGAHGQAVKVVIHKDQDAQQHGHQLCAGAGLNRLGCPTTESSGAAALVHQVDHDAQQHQEHHDGEVCIGNDAQIAGCNLNNRIPGVKLGIQQSANQHTDKQRRIYFLADQCQYDSHHGGQQGPDGACERGSGLDHFTIHFKDGQRCALECDAKYDQQHDKYAKCNQIRDLGTLFFHNVIYLLLIGFFIVLLPPSIVKLLALFSFFWQKTNRSFRFFHEKSGLFYTYLT